MITASMSLFSFDLFGAARTAKTSAKAEIQEPCDAGDAAPAIEDRVRGSGTDADARTEREEGFYWLGYPIY
jgi:hypothetical protein